MFPMFWSSWDWRGVKTACLQAYYTKCWKFKAPQWIRRPGDSADLLKAAEEAFVKCRPAWPEAPQSRSAAGRQPDGPVFPEDRPYLAELHAFLLSRLESGIVIRAVEHMAYAERYTFMRGAEKATIDFFYNGKGRFRPPQVKASLGNSPELAEEVLRGVRDEGRRISGQ